MAAPNARKEEPRNRREEKHGDPGDDGPHERIADGNQVPVEDKRIGPGCECDQIGEACDDPGSVAYGRFLPDLCRCRCGRVTKISA